MKRDIQICYNEIEIICNSLNSFKTALEEIKASMKKFDGYIQMNSGKTINELIDKNSIINDELNTCEEEVKDLYDIFKGYIEATSYYIKAVNPSAMMRVDRNDIWWNLFSVSSIKASCDNLAFLKCRQYSTTSAPFYLDEEERDRENRRLRHNYNEMEEYREKFCRAYEHIQDELDELERIYKNKIIEFENADDHYASKASELYDKYSSRGEKIWDFVEGAGKAIYDLLDGALTAVDDLVTGIINLIGGLVIFTAADLVYLATLPFGVTPKWASDCVTEVDTTVKAILKDPVLIVEGMAQEGSDAVEEKGIAFGIGFVGGNIAADILVSKGIGKLKALNKMDDAAKIASKTDEAGNIAKNANILSGSADDVAEAGAKAGAVGGGSPTKLNYTTSNGLQLETTPGKTTTVLGTYNSDTGAILDELGNVKSLDFGPKDGGFNLLNTPDELYVSPKQFWNEYNKPWLDNVIARNDSIKIATEPTFGNLTRINKVTGKMELTGFGREFTYLRKNGYYYDTITKMMTK
ncbi:hypothetical protein EDD66_103114 [Mobilisporobacter senegalensis]|uniref:LXG domain-containing protein n=1 Tax=Mobilisporobacter senegalensis TaxID=1329262 RepID=A0A3N1XR84_9FIRM|nr:hypothetical protein [Mobilisporobacter senegalensis]ROR29179.1 hypothetical protein EDD66_103114 [Mobilisporobacter senegalensis]